MKNNIGKHLRIWIFILLVFGTIVWFSWQMSTETGEEISELQFVTYDNVLYSPEELKTLTEEQRNAGHVGWDYSYYDKEFSRVRTNYLVLHLEPGETYGLYTEQATYAARIWVDGNLLAEKGTVSDSPEGFMPWSGTIVVYFTAGEETEIVMQRANFNHAKWNAARLYIGKQDVITRQAQVRFFREVIYLGFLTAIGMLNFGMFLGVPDQKGFLWFSLGCFTAMIHQSLQDPKVIMQVFPSLNWYVGYKTEGISLILLTIFMILFMIDCFGRSLWKWVDTAVLVSLGLLGCIILILPTLLYTRYTVELSMWVAVLAVLFCMLLVVKAIIKWKQLEEFQRYFLAGVLVFLLTAVLSILRVGPRHVNQIRIGMILFELIITLSLSTQFQTIRKAYLESKQNEARMKEMNESMAETQELQENFLAIMNHEMCTPLTVIAGYADLSAAELGQESGKEEMVRNLTLIKREALRLGRIVEQTGEGARFSLGSGQKESVSVRKLLEDARTFCLPICEKRGNAIWLECEEKLELSCVRDSLLQALYNLILNASRHTDHGTIRISAAVKDSDVLIMVSDNGDGMDEETRRHAFEKGYSRDGGHGIGLALCKEIVERHRGTIRLESNIPSGTIVVMTLPSAGEE